MFLLYSHPVWKKSKKSSTYIDRLIDARARRVNRVDEFKHVDQGVEDKKTWPKFRVSVLILIFFFL